MLPGGIAGVVLLGALAAGAALTGEWRLAPEKAGLDAAGLRLPDAAFAPSSSRGWQFLAGPLTAGGDRGTLAVSDGLFWSMELRALVRMEGAEVPAVVGLVYAYENPGSYAVLLWNTRTGDLALRALRQGRAAPLAAGKAGAGKRPWRALVLRTVMDDLAFYLDGEKVLTAKNPALLGRVAVFALGDTVRLDGLEVRRLDPGEADADIFGRSRTAYEANCTACHELDGPWNSQFAPDQWENVVNEMLASEGADEFISRKEANRIVDYLRIISLHPDANHYRPGQGNDH